MLDPKLVPTAGRKLGVQHLTTTGGEQSPTLRGYLNIYTNGSVCVKWFQLLESRSQTRAVGQTTRRKSTLLKKRVGVAPKRGENASKKIRVPTVPATGCSTSGLQRRGPA